MGAESSDSPQTVTVSNNGNQALVFTAVSYPADFPEASGGGVDLCTSSTSLDSGQECDLNIEFAPEQTGTLSENVTLTDNVLNVTGTEQSIAVKGTATPSIVATHFSVTGPSNVGAYAPFTVTVTALDVSGGTASGYTGTVSFTSSDGSAVLPAASKLTAGIGNFPVTLKTQGNQTITVTDAANSLDRNFCRDQRGRDAAGGLPWAGQRKLRLAGDRLAERDARAELRDRGWYDGGEYCRCDAGGSEPGLYQGHGRHVHGDDVLLGYELHSQCDLQAQGAGCALRRRRAA